MDVIGNVMDRQERKPYVTFERVAIEDKRQSLLQGIYVAKDVDQANITPAYTKDKFKQKVSDWLPDMKQQAMNGRIPRQWVEEYEAEYNAWLNGQAMPLNGTAIRGWSVISPAQQETLIRMRILTVEDLSSINDEGIRRIGMGAMEMKNKAVAWLLQSKDKGHATMEIASLKTELEILKSSLEKKDEQVEKLMALVRQGQVAQITEVPTGTISISSILNDQPAGSIQEQYEAKFGKKPHHKMKIETITNALKG